MAGIDGVTAAAEEYGHEQFHAGLLAGLAVAEKIHGWLTAQPDSIRQRQQREWAEAAIADAKRMHASRANRKSPTN